MSMDQLNSAVGLRAAQKIEPANMPAATIVSDVLLYREGLAASLLRNGRVKIFDLVTSTDALPVITRNPPDILLLDGALVDCLQLARKIRVSVASARIVGFGISGGADRLVDCAQSGFSAFVGSESSIEELVTVIFRTLHGELICSPRVSALMCERLARLTMGSTKSGALTRREREIAVLIAQGLSNKEIAIDLRIGASTVKNHVHSILEKLDVRRRSAIVHQLSQTSPIRAGCSPQAQSTES